MLSIIRNFSRTGSRFRSNFQYRSQPEEETKLREYFTIFVYSFSGKFGKVLQNLSRQCYPVGERKWSQKNSDFLFRNYSPIIRSFSRLCPFNSPHNDGMILVLMRPLNAMGRFVFPLNPCLSSKRFQKTWNEWKTRVLGTLNHNTRKFSPNKR